MLKIPLEKRYYDKLLAIAVHVIIVVLLSELASLCHWIK